jgi:hypothetical protein
VARPRVRLNGSGVQDLLHDPGVVAELASRMEDVLHEATVTAPVDSGAYVGSLRVEEHDHGDRTVVQVVADVDHALAVEARLGVLSRALDAAGGRPA